jgi:hypothetical protein
MQLFTLLSSQWRWKQSLALLLGWTLLFTNAADKIAGDYFVKSLPGQPAGVPLTKMYAG